MPLTPEELDDLEKELPPSIRIVVAMMRSFNEELQQSLEQLRAENAELKRMLFGRKSEKLPSARREAAKKAREQETDEQKEERRKRTQRRRKQAREQKKELETEDLVCELPEAERVCKVCGGDRFAKVGDGHVNFRYEYVVEKVIRQRVVREVWACECDECLLTAAPPAQVTEGTGYGPQMYARVVVDKCADSMPLHRQAKRLRRSGVPIDTSTLCDLFHRSADLLRPLYERMVERMAGIEHINADETRLKVQHKGGCKEGWTWTFIGGGMIVYSFSETRSGQTPQRILGHSTGTLQVDGYTGYNKVTTPSRRTRAGCWAHARRKVFNALEHAPEHAGKLMDLLGEIYLVEHVARERGVVGTKAHLVLRQSESKPTVGRIFALVDEQMELHPPKGPMGKALRYIHNSREALQVFLGDPNVHIDNNVAERALRIIALGRKNFLFAGNNGAAQNLAVLQTLVSTCIDNGVNPQHYLADVLIRIQDTPVSRIDELLPMDWTPPDSG